MIERQRALDECEKIKVSMEDTQGLLMALEGARMQVSSTADELKALTTIIRERVNTLCRELAAIQKEIGRRTQPGDAW
jgi:hypothetical protein